MQSGPASFTIEEKDLQGAPFPDTPWAHVEKDVTAVSVKTPKSLRAYYDSERFEKEYLYDGPLGPDYSRDGTRL